MGQDRDEKDVKVQGLRDKVKGGLRGGPDRGRYLLMYRCGGLVAKAGGSKGHALHDGHGGEGHPHGHVSHRPDVVN